MADDAEARRRARRHWPIRKFALGQEPSEDIRAETSVEQRLAMMWPLAVRAWTLSGRPMPQYSRAEIPGRIIRPPTEDEP